MSELSFEPAKDEDIAAVAGILTEATVTKTKYGDNSWGAEGWSEEEVRDAMTESIVYTIRQGAEVVGTVSLQWDDERNWGSQPPAAGYLHRLAIKDGFRGRGIGERAIEWAIEQVTKNGRKFLRLDCEAKNTKLCKYYEGLGFVQVGTRPIAEYGDYVAALYERPIET